jgi:HAD superfamily hydrolase (TIGR01549 family)
MITESTGTQKIEGLTKTLQKMSKEERTKAFEMWKEEELEALPKMTANKNGMKIYESYSNKPSALVTMQGKEAVNAILKRTKLKFRFTITREDSLDRAEQIKMAVKKLKINHEKVLIVGDRETDFAAARKTGCHFLRV